MIAAAIPPSCTVLDPCPVAVEVSIRGDVLVSPGAPIAWAIDVANVGSTPVPATSVLVTDPTSTITAPALDAPLAPGEVRAWGASAVAPAGLDACGQDVLTTVSVALVGLPDGVVDSGVGARTATAQPVRISGPECIPVLFTPPRGVLEIDHRAQRAAAAGSVIALRASVRNAGSAPLDDVLVQIAPGAGLAVVRMAAGASRTRGAFWWEVGGMDAGTAVTRVVRARVVAPPGGRACSTASARARATGRIRARACIRVRPGRAAHTAAAVAG